MWMQQFMQNLIRYWKRSKRRDVEAFTAWAQEHAVPVTPLDGMRTDVEKLSFLDNLLAGKRIVYLGEEDHWIHEKTEYRLLLLRYLFSRGWRYVGEELGWSDGTRIDRYLATGDESYLDCIATYGYAGDLRTDRDDRPTGILKDGSEDYPVESFAAEQIRLAKALRQLSEQRPSGSKRLHFFGFDVDALAGGGYRDAAELLAPSQGDPVVAELQALLSPVPDETLEQEIARLTRTLEFIENRKSSLVAILGEADFHRVHNAVAALCDSLRFIRLANPALDYATLNRAMAEREQSMCRRVQSLLSRMGPDEKLVLMGHNRHLSKDIAAIKNAGGAPPGGRLVPSLGTYLHHLLPGQVFSIWMIHDHGASSQPYASLSKEYVSRPGTLNAMLSEVGEAYLLPTATKDPRARLLAAEMDIVGIYNVTYRTAIAKQADAIFFVRKVSPLTI